MRHFTIFFEILIEITGVSTSKITLNTSYRLLINKAVRPISTVDISLVIWFIVSYSVTPEYRVAESRWVGKPLTSIILLIGSNNTATRLKTINNIL